MSAEKQTEVLLSMPMGQLQSIQQSLEQEVQVLTTSLQQLHAAQQQFQNSLSALESLSKTDETSSNTLSLIPVTHNVYVKAKLASNDHFLVDIGTGYLVEKTRQQAQVFYKGKMELLETRMQQAQQAVTMKRQQLAHITDVWEYRLQMAKKVESSGPASGAVTA